MSTSDIKRISLGLVTSVGVLFVLDVSASLLEYFGAMERAANNLYSWRAVETAVAMFVAASVGAYVARAGFIGPAVLLTLGIWAFVVHTLNSIAAAAGQSDLPGVAMQNVLSLLLGLAGAVAGAWLGERLSGRGGSNASTSV